MKWGRVGMVTVALSILSACFNHPSAPVIDLSPVDVRKGVYHVYPGDTLYAISFRSGIDYRKIAKWNGIESPYTIYVGDKLRLKPPNQVEQQQMQQAKAQPQRAIKKQAASPAALPPVSLPSRVAAWQWPTRGRLLSGFRPGNGVQGVQIKAAEGSPVLAAASGQVVYVGSGIKGYGELLIIKHSEQFLSAYAHNRKVTVREGQFIKRGQPVAEVGRTGTDVAKLHFEIRHNGEPVDPQRYLPSSRS